MTHKLNVLVTGGAGYIGSHAVLALLEAGHRAVVIDNLVTGFRWAIAKDAVFYEGDISNTELIQQIIREQAIDAIMHFAGSVVVPESVQDPLKYYNNNTVKSRSLIESAITGGVRHMIFRQPLRLMASLNQAQCARIWLPFPSTLTARRN